MTQVIPSRVFIIPYRDRPTQKNEFLSKIKNLLEDSAESLPYEIYFAHQCDKRPFNRGAMKNIGFLAIRKKYPNNYKNITFIFHDVDTWPTEKGLIDYDTSVGTIKHYYGYKFALGGIFAIKGIDFERSLGFPNFWGWGLEDNAINDKCKKLNIKIDRTIFYEINDKRIARPFDGFKRILSRRDGVIYKFETPDNYTHINNLKYNIITENSSDKVYSIDITFFTCKMNVNDQEFVEYDIRNGPKIVIPQGYFRRPWSFSYMMKK